MTREEAKKWLNKLYARADITDEYGDMEDTQPYEEAVDMAIEALEQTRWIPVNERLPEKNMKCLVTVGDFNLVQMAMYSNLMKLIDHRIFYQGECGDETFKNITQYVKAWMPLPPCYEPQESEE